MKRIKRKQIDEKTYARIVYECSICKRVYKKAGICSECEVVLKQRGS